MLSILDRYIMKELWRPFLMGTLGFIVMNLANLLYIYANLIVQSGVPVLVVVKLLLYNLPAIVVITFPVSFLFATLLACGRLSKDSEIIALRAVGTPFRRISVPIILASVLLSYVGFVVNDDLVPWANRQTVQLVRTLMLRQSKAVFRDNIFFKGPHQNIYFYIRQVDMNTNVMYDVFVYDRLNPLPVVFTAREGTWSGSTWHLRNGIEHRYEDPKGQFVSYEIPFKSRKVDVGTNPSTFFTQEDLSPQEMKSTDLAAQIKTMKEGGMDTKTREVDFNMKFSLPLATFFCALLAAPLGMRYSRMGGYIGVALTIAVVFVYYIVMSICRSMGNAGMLDPVTGAWFENYLFGVLGAFLLWRVDR
ncbi:MAG TPA: hypothetical protein DD435_17345 [Cyanobacteria bacterium UBA8530]|nr:hypothetical protein [Cyanobacteria bacterium UBA8530]